MKKVINSLVVAAVITSVVFPAKADAYLDPGTGSYVLQIAAAVLFGGIFVVKTFWNNITMFFKSLIGGKGKKTLDNTPQKHK